MGRLKSQFLFYSQHSIGVGHYMRIRQILKALAGETVHFINGGAEVEALEDIADVTVTHLPTVRFDPQTGALNADEDELKVLLKKRAELVRQTFEQVQPSVMVIEFFPFGCWNLRSELLPILETTKLSKPRRTRLVCSLRDVPQESFKESYEMRCCAVLNTYFDHLLIHSDPEFFHLKDSFPSWKKIKISTHYTGYVSMKYKSGVSDEVDCAIRPEDKIILVTAGSGADAYGTFDYLKACIQAKVLLGQHIKVKMLIYTGCFFSDDRYAKLKAFCQDQDIILKRFTSQILYWMKRAELSISRGGYNTCMNILETGVRSVTVPVGLSNDQNNRAKKMAALNLTHKLDEADLTPENLCNTMLQALKSPPAKHQIRLDGAYHTAELLKNLKLYSNQNAHCQMKATA